VELGVHTAGALAAASAACKTVGDSKQHDSAKVCHQWLVAHHVQDAAAMTERAP